MKFLAFFLTALLVGSSSLRAQDDGRVVKFRLLCYEHAQDTLSGLALGSAGDKLEVDFYTGGIGPQLSARFTDNKARFFKETQGADGKVITTVIAEGTLGPSGVQMFLLLPEATSKGQVYRILTFDDLESSFPMGSTRVINLAPFPIRLNLAGAEMPPIQPGDLKVYPLIKKVDEWNMFTARIEFGVKADKWVPVATQSWKASERKRDWTIVHFNSKTRAPVIRLYQDIPPWRKTVLTAPKRDSP
jgi:hypothetical protein